MAKFYNITGIPLVVSKKGKAFAWEDARMMPVPAGLAAPGAELTVGEFERTFPKVNMKHLFDTIGAGNPLSLLANSHLQLAQSAEDENEVDYRMEIVEKTWQEL